MVRKLLIYIFAFFAASASNPVTSETSLFETNGRIVGGIDTSIDRFPFQASLRFFGAHRCGAIIIKLDAVITAAHCIDQQDVWYITVKAGSSRWDGDEEGNVQKVKSIVQHEGFLMSTLDNDIALLFLESGFIFTPTIQPAILASVGEELKAGTKAYVSGWGTLIEDGQYFPDRLQYAVVMIWSQKDCESAYDGINEVTERMFCAGEKEGGKDACQGDSGGPLVVGNKLFGAISWGLGCARPGKPSVYSKISVYRPWIDSHLKN